MREPGQNEIQKNYDLESPEMQLPSKIDEILKTEGVEFKVSGILRSEEIDQNAKKEQVLALVKDVVTKLTTELSDLLEGITGPNSDFTKAYTIFTVIEKSVFKRIFKSLEDVDNLNKHAYAIYSTFSYQNRLQNYDYPDPNIPEISIKNASITQCTDLYNWLKRNPESINKFIEEFITKENYQKLEFENIANFLADFEKRQALVDLRKDILTEIETYVMNTQN